MEKKEILTQIKELSKKYFQSDLPGDEPLYIENLLKNYLEKHPKDTQLWLQLIVLYYTPFFGRYAEDVFPCLNKILEYDPENIYANIMVAFFHDAFYGSIPDDIYQKINHLKSNNLHDLAMLEVTKSLYFRDKEDYCQQENCLKKAILFDSNISKPYVYLGRLYKVQGKINLAKEYFKKGLKKVICTNIEKNLDKDMTSYEDFFNYFIKGTHLTSPTYEFIIENLEDLESKNL